MNDNKPYTHKDGRKVVVDDATQQFIIHGPEGSTAVLSYGDMEALRGYFEAQGSSKSRCSSTCSHGGSCSLEANHGGNHETRDSLGRDTYCHWGAPEQRLACNYWFGDPLSRLRFNRLMRRTRRTKCPWVSTCD